MDIDHKIFVVQYTAILNWKFIQSKQNQEIASVLPPLLCFGSGLAFGHLLLLSLSYVDFDFDFNLTLSISL